MHKTIKDYIYENLNPNEQQIALEFVVFLEENGMTFYKLVRRPKLKVFKFYRS